MCSSDLEELDRFVGPGIYWKDNESYFRELSSDFSNHNMLMTTEGRVFVITDNLETVLFYDKSDLYHKSIDNPKYRLLTNNDSEYIVLDNSNIPLATINCTGDMFLYKNKLYSLNNESIWEIDLNMINQPPSLWQSVYRTISKYIFKYT